MRKRILWLLISPLCFLDAVAEEYISAETEVRYLVTYMADTVSHTMLADTFCLRFNDEKSLFYETSTFRYDSLRYNDIAKWSEMMSKLLTTPSPRAKGWAKYYVLTDYDKGEYIYQDNISGSKYRYSENCPSFDWKIIPEYKTIANSKCQKAEGSYMGRKYEAWFATNIRTKASPWKFYGLPGLIMEVNDTQHFYNFTVLDVYPCTGEIKLFPSKHFKTTKEKYLHELELYLKDPVYYQENIALIKIISHNPTEDSLTAELRKRCRHQPMEIINWE